MSQSTPDPQKGRAPEPDGSKADGAAPNGSADGAKASGSAEPKPDDIDPFNPELYRVHADGEPGSLFEVAPTRVPVLDKPKKNTWFRAYPGFAMRVRILEHEVGFEKQAYIVTPRVAFECMDEVKEVDLYLCVDRNGALFVLYLPAFNPDKKPNSYTESKRRGLERSKSVWLRMKSDQVNAQWRPVETKIFIPEPKWPEITERDILERAFGQEYLINDTNHPLLQALRGEA
jgi:hypothetical protein